MPREKSDQLTEQESRVLAIVARQQPLTAYAIRKIIEGSPLASLSSSSGAIYPMVMTLKKRGYISADPAQRGRRTSELLSITADGRSELRNWILRVKPEHLLVEDPLRARITVSDFVENTELKQWIGDLIVSLEKKSEELDEYQSLNPGRSLSYAHTNAKMSTRMRIDWLRAIADDLNDGAD